jgi:hypothetical protein
LWDLNFSAILPLLGPIIGSSSNGGGKDVIDKVLFADRLSPDVKHREKARKEQDEKAAAAGRSKHLLLKFQDLPVWESNLCKNY